MMREAVITLALVVATACGAPRASDGQTLAARARSCGDWITSAKNRNHYKSFCLPLEEAGGDWPRGFRVIRRERAQAADAWEELVVEYSTPFDLECATSIWMEDVLLHGTSSSGDSVLEYWSFTPEPGGWSSKADGASTPIGVPGPTFASHTESIQGGVFVPLSTRGTLGRPGKRELYRGQAPLVEAAAIDLDLRYVVFAGRGPDGLFMLDLSQANPTPVEILSAAAAPELADASDIYILQHATLGRCFVVDLLPSDLETQASTLAVWDHDNDGVVDLVEPFVLDGFYSAYPDDQWRYDLMP